VGRTIALDNRCRTIITAAATLTNIDAMVLNPKNRGLPGLFLDFFAATLFRLKISILKPCTFPDFERLQKIASADSKQVRSLASFLPDVRAKWTI
jgi:hypothetical protein